MKNLKTIIGLAAMALCLGFASCSSDDDAPSYSTAAVSNSELMTILKDKGYQFNEQGNLLLDDKATSTTSLDLSGTKISQKALAELNILPNLTDVNLSNNGYGPVFHVDSLPAQIKGLDLQGNEIYDFEGLVDVSSWTSDMKATVLHSFDKLYLPTSCKYNVEDLMPFYVQNQTDNKSVDMQIADSKGKLNQYNTIREIPDTYFCDFLKTKYSSLFTDETHIDISKQLNTLEQGEHLMMGYMTPYEHLNDVKSIEGVEYFINNPFLKEFGIALNCTNHCSMAYVAPRSNIKAIILNNIDTPAHLDLSQASEIAHIQITNNSKIEKLDLSKTKVLNQDTKDFDVLFTNTLVCKTCSHLKKIELPKTSLGYADAIVIADLPKLESIDLSFLQGIQELALLSIPNCSILYPIESLKYRYKVSSGELKDLSSKNKITFSLSQDVFKQASSKEFIEKFESYMKDGCDDYGEYNAYAWK